MEDYSRDLEKELTRYAVPNPFKQSKNWKLIFVSDDGQTISVNKYKGLVVSVFSALAVAVILAVTVSVLYGKSLAKNKRLADDLTQKTIELQKEIEEKELLNAKLFLLKKDTIVVEEKKIAVNDAETVTKKVEKPKEKPQMKADIIDLSFSKVEGSPTTRIRFQIRNTGTLNRISGYVYVIMKPDLESDRGWLTLPPANLKEGIPATHKKGRYFSINNFKTMHFKYNDKNLVQKYNNITVFIFSRDGKNVYEKTYPVEVKIVKRKEKPKPTVKVAPKTTIVKTKTVEKKEPIAVAKTVVETGSEKQTEPVVQGTPKTDTGVANTTETQTASVKTDAQPVAKAGPVEDTEAKPPTTERTVP